MVMEFDISRIYDGLFFYVMLGGRDGWMDGGGLGETAVISLELQKANRYQ